MIFGMPVLVENKTLEDNISLCQKLSLSFIELNMSFKDYQLENLKNCNLKEKMFNNNIFFTIHLDENLNITDFNPLVRKAYLDTVIEVIKLAKENHIPVLNMHMHHGIKVTLPDKIVMLYDVYFAEYLKNIKAFREMVTKEIGDADIKISIENTEPYTDYEKQAVECLLESKAFSLTWDIGHSVATKEADLPFIMEHKDRLRHFHIHDGKLMPPQNHMTLGTGEINLQERLALAKALNCTCVIETKTIKALSDSVSWLKERNYL